MKSDQIENFPGILPSGEIRQETKRHSTATMRVMRAGSEDIVVGENSSLEGSFETQGSMFVDGSLMGADLRTTLLSIGVSGSVAGNAHVSRAEIAGTFDGQLIVSGEVILRSTSHVTGEITCGKLISHRGATVRAHVNVLEDEYEETGDDMKPIPVLKFQNRISKASMRRAIVFAYGVFFTLGTIGIVSYL
ncbi:MAG: polymer-forming cytoskeletal protein [Pseudomonadota bacterium]